MESSRERSPNYPSYSLEAAIGFVQRLYEAEKRASVAVVVVGQALSGNENARLSGPLRSKIAALRAYGLVDEVAPGKLRVSDRALGILQRPTEATYASAVKEAALAPPLFAELHTEYADASDGALKYALMTEKKFTEDGANRAIKAFRETLLFASLTDTSYNEESIPAAEQAESAKIFRSEPVITAMSRGEGLIEEKTSQPKARHLSYTWPLPDGVDAEVTLLGNRPTVRAIDRLITYLQFMRDDLEGAGGEIAGQQGGEIADAGMGE